MMLPIASCTDYEALQEPELTMDTYHGTLLEFLEDKTSGRGVAFDSLLYLLEQYPDVKETLSDPQGNATLFAVPNECFASAFGTLNAYRQNNKLGNNLALKDFMIAPFTVIDTLITRPDTPLADTTYIYRKYNYKAQVDSLLCRYIFPEAILSDAVISEGGAIEQMSFLFNHRMQLKASRGNASGATALGKKQLQLIEMNGSKLQAQWVTGQVQQMDIKASNGIIHILSPLHEFGFNETLYKFKDYGNERETK